MSPLEAHDRTQILRPLRGLTVVVLALGWLVAAGRAEIKLGDMFPSLAAANLSGTVPETAGKVTVIDFWASWCAPCKASFPAYARIQADFASRGFMVVAVSVDEKSSNYEAFVKKFRPGFVTLHDGSKQLVSTVQIPGMPTSYLLGRDGRVRYIHTGFHGAATERELRSQIETLLAESK